MILKKHLTFNISRFIPRISHYTVLLLFLITHNTFHITQCYSVDNGNMNVKITIIENVWHEWDDCDSHYWEDPMWGWGSWQRKTDHEWGSFHGRDCVRLTSTNTYAGAMATRTKTFPQENWRNNVDKVRMDVYVEYLDSTTDLKFESKDSAGDSIQVLLFNDLPTGQWVDCVWDIDESLAGYADVKQLIFIPDGLSENNPCTYYFENLRLVMTDNTTWYWDNFNDPSNKWTYGGDAIVAAESAITHNTSTMTSNAGGLSMGWDSTIDGGTNEAKFETPEYFDLSSYTKVRAEIRCTSTAADIAIGFWNDSQGWKVTATQTVSTANAWETIEWNMPSGTAGYWSAVKVIPVIMNTDEVNMGKIYIDNIHFQYLIQ